MAAIISISSDEEQSDEISQPARKKQKSDSVICLDDDEDRNKLSEDDDDDVILGTSDDELRSGKNKVKLSDEDEPGRNQGNGNDVVIDSEDDKLDSLSTSSKDGLDDEIQALNLRKNNKDREEDGDENLPTVSSELFDKHDKMQSFLNLCLSKITSEDTKKLFKSKIPFCKKLFAKIGEDYIKSEEFEAFLDTQIESSQISSLVAVTCFNDVYQHLKNKLRNSNSDSGEALSNKHKVIIAKLEHALRKVKIVLGKLEEAEVDFDEEDDSSYIKMQRYRERAVKIYEKICKYKKEDVNATNMLYNRLDFSGSNYSEFNHAINKKFKNNSIFPTYYEVERCLQKAAKNKDMNLSEGELKLEARECFKNLGNLLQRRRKIDLLNVHSYYLVTNDDPAFENEELDSKLRENLKEAESKIDEICLKYVKLENSGANPNLSSDSDDSNKESTEDDDGDDK